MRELDRVLGITAALDEGLGQVKQRARGLSAGQTLMTMASAQLAGEEFMVGLDRRRADTAGQVLEPVPTPASTTWAGNARRFTDARLAGLPAAMKTINTRWVSRLPAPRRGVLLREATIDGDATDVEVYGRSKDGAAHAYTGGGCQMVCVRGAYHLEGEHHGDHGSQSGARGASSASEGAC
ncbi:hypothetical protein [Microbacterium sp.]|uniref:hypothetical protein n=1 Tax=Microbacterium sp. TaxID=51671 RepID=UPI003C70FB5A